MTRRKSTAVGYGNPPVHTRFPKGTSGNRHGRPKGSQNVLDAFKKLLYKRMKVPTRNGRMRTVTMVEAFFSKMFKEALDGNVQAMKLIGEFIEAAQVVDIAEEDRPRVLVLTGADVDL